MTDPTTNAPADLPALDWLAALTAGACAVHCAVLPLAIAAVPAVGAAWLTDERLGNAALMLSVLLAVLALTRGCLQHRSARPAGVAAAGFAALVVAEAALESSLLGRAVLSGSGGLLVAGAHLLNRSLCLSCRACRRSTHRLGSRFQPG
jgi:MerC mercury resistance protein